jgi:hypothetical protein
MGVLNKRNAVLGWTVWTIGKRTVWRKSRTALAMDEAKKRRKQGAIAGLLAATGGTLLVWRRRRTPEPPE